MIEIRLHGRGGQGAVTSAELLAQAAIAHGKYGQAFPSFGPERRGAPVAAFVRISDEPIRTREKIYQPDVVVVLDASVLEFVNVAEGLKSDGTLIINAPVCEETCRADYGFRGRLAFIDADKIAAEVLGVPITNTTMLGAVLKATGVLKPDDMAEAINQRFGPKLGPKNFKALETAFGETMIQERD